MNPLCSNLRKIIMSNVHIWWEGHKRGGRWRASTEKRGKYSAELSSRCSAALTGLSAALIWQPITHWQTEERREAFWSLWHHHFWAWTVQSCLKTTQTPPALARSRLLPALSVTREGNFKHGRQKQKGDWRKTNSRKWSEVTWLRGAWWHARTQWDKRSMFKP